MFMVLNFGVMNDVRAVERFYTAWRKPIRRNWRIDKRTNNLYKSFIDRLEVHISTHTPTRTTII